MPSLYHYRNDLNPKASEFNNLFEKVFLGVILSVAKNLYLKGKSVKEQKVISLKSWRNGIRK